MLVTVVLGVAQIALSVGQGPVAVIAIPLEVVVLGFGATQRIWFLRVLRQKRMRADEVWPLTVAFIGRTFCLAVLVALALVALVILTLVGTAWAAARGVGGHLVPPVHQVRAVPLHDRLILSVHWYLMDIALTLVVPALAFSTRRVGVALREGLRMIRSTWPSSAWYVLTPGLALSTIGLAPGPFGGLAVRSTAIVVGALAALWFKGAIAIFYLRRHSEVGDDGAAYVGRGPSHFGRTVSPMRRHTRLGE